MKFEMETVREIWNSEDKSHIEIGADRDGLRCVEIRYFNEDNKITERMSFPPDQAKLIAKAIELCAIGITSSYITESPAKVINNNSGVLKA
jgi:hypothetical protein